MNVGMAGLHAVAAGSRDAATLLRVAAGRLGLANSAKLWSCQKTSRAWSTAAAGLMRSSGYWKGSPC